LTSFYNKYFGQCSRAFIRLESLNVDEKQKDNHNPYKQLALNIFIKNPPQDPSSRLYPCPSGKCSSQVPEWATSCPDCDRHFPACTVSGRAILTTDTYRCRICKHQAFERELRKQTNCPLCHGALR